MATEGVEAIKRRLEKRIEKKEEQVLKIEANVFQLANYYFVFQGVILTAIVKGSSTSSSSLKCQYFWIPFSLSFVGALLNLGTLIVMAHKYKESLDQLDERTLILYQHLYPDNPETSRAMHNIYKQKKAWRRSARWASMVLVSIFALLNLVITVVIPCFT